MNFLKKYFILIFILSTSIIFYTSCVPQSRLKYAQTNSVFDTVKTYTTEKRQVSTIQAGDDLYIKVLSYDEKSFKFFNSFDQMNMGSTQSLYNLISYTVSDSGFISYPFIGKIYLKGYTIDKAKTVIQDALKDYLDKPSVIVKYVNRFITILGEVNRPGRYEISKDEINIFEAIGMAGDIAYYGNKNHVTLVRMENNKTNYHTLDLTKRSIAQSEYFFLKPNDIIYVQPLKHKEWGIAAFPYATVFSAITTMIIVLNYIK